MNFVKNFYRSVVKVHPQTESSPSGAMYLQRENGKVMLKVDPNAEKHREEETVDTITTQTNTFKV